MNTKQSFKLPIHIDNSGQILVTLTVAANNRSIDVDFKLDTGCNSVVLSRETLEKLGVKTDAATMSKRAPIEASVADGSVVSFRQAGNVNLYSGRDGLGEIDVICHATHETRNLLGTSALHKFARYAINVKDYQYLELNI
ncbi:MAG: retroviral-like aspartic protease family protein [Clostridiales bacterium]|nr:retroviral-like aspartic protease family protein [Clostridiales bacterium]